MIEERWKVIYSAPDYKISNLGNVKNRITGKPIRTHTDYSGYLKVSLRSNRGKQINKRIHVLVAEAFSNGGRSGDFVYHIDQDKTNNDISNLRWMTQSDYVMHKMQTGEMKRPGYTTAVRIRMVETGAMFSSINECARVLGVHTRKVQACLDGHGDPRFEFHLEKI
jgi:hypothetical protein